MTEKGVEFETVNYLEKPLTAAELKRLLRSGGLKAADVLRRNEAAYRELVAGKDLGEEQLVSLMAKHPELIQRPIVVRGGKAVLAREVERARNLILEFSIGSRHRRARQGWATRSFILIKHRS